MHEEITENLHKSNKRKTYINLISDLSLLNIRLYVNA